jgi:hypothetical protein
MEYIKHDIPDSQALKERLAVALRRAHPDIVHETTIVRREAKRLSKRLGIFTASYITILLLFGYFDLGIVFFIALVAGAYYLYICGRDYVKSQADLSSELTKSLLSVLRTVFPKFVKHKEKIQHDADTMTLLKISGLINESDYDVDTDDLFEMGGPMPHTVRELFVTQMQGSGKNRRRVTLFRGVFVVGTLPKVLHGKTVISTRGDLYNLSHNSFWGALTGTNNLEETKLEWNQFEKDMFVATNNPVEARVILTPNFMSDLHNWWVVEKVNMRIAFFSNHFFMLLPHSGVYLGNAPQSDSFEKIEKYLRGMAEPIWRAQLLIEDIKL